MCRGRAVYVPASAVSLRSSKDNYHLTFRKRTYMHNTTSTTDTISSPYDCNSSFGSVLFDNCTPPSNTDTGLHIKLPALGVLLASFSLIVVTGNIMVIVAVARELYLKTATNYLIVSLAVADVMVGGIVMPFSISQTITNERWMYGEAWCDLWHSFDVLASTASILNLCVISLDRYWAITDPIAYPTIMSNHKVSLLIAIVWVCSAGISFPAILWWRGVMTSWEPSKCEFTKDGSYLIISALVSFYIPTVIMIFVYAKILRTAMAQCEGIKTGVKVTADCPRGEDGELVTLRIHKGGYRGRNDTSPGGSGASPTHHKQHKQHDSRQSSTDSESHSPLTMKRTNQAYQLGNNNHQGNGVSTNHLEPPPRSSKFIGKKIRHFAISKKISKIAREQKAAKTLGIVVGVFIMCWVPFFSLTMIMSIWGEDSVYKPHILFPIFSWLGYINSGMNPIIYALSMRDFRRAFSKMIFCCPRYRHSHAIKNTYQYANSSSTSSFNVTACPDRTLLKR